MTPTLSKPILSRMDPSQILFLSLIGLCAGIGSGLFGIGGGVVIVPMLVLMYGLPQKEASATSLVALVLPVGILGVISYYRSGIIDNSNIKMGLFVSLGIFIGTLLGSKLALALPTRVITKAFALFLVYVAIRLWLQDPKT